MNKAISVAAILALAAASNEFADHELINLHLEQPRLHRPTFSPLVRDVAHDDEQMVRLAPELYKPHYRTFTPLVADDNDDELVYATAVRLDDDDEFYFDEQGDNELGFFKSLGNGLKKAGQFVVQNPKVLTTAAKFLDDNDDEFFVDQQADDEFLIRLDPELTRPRIRYPLPILAVDDNDDEFFVDQQADDEFLIRLDPELTRPRLYHPLPVLAKDDNDDEFAFVRADDNDDEFFVDEQGDNELGFFKSIGNGLKKAGQFVVQNPKVLTTAAKFLDDNDDEFFVDQQADDELLIRLDPELTRPRTYYPRPILAADDNDDEFAFISAVRLDDNDDELYADDEYFVDEQDDEFFAHDAAFIKKAQREVRQDSLSSLGGLLKEGKKVQHLRRPQPVKPQEVQDNMNFLEDFQDNNLSIKDKLKGAANWIGDHPQVITEAAKTYKTLKGKH